MLIHHCFCFVKFQSNNLYFIKLKLFNLQVALLTVINGENAQKKGKDIIVSVAEAIIDPNILPEFTWSGKSNDKNKKKIKFAAYKEISGIIHTTCRRADSSYSVRECEKDLTYIVLKYALQRQLSKKRYL